MLHAIIVGYLGADCTRQIVNGKTVLNFSVAHSDSYINAKSEKIETTQWVSCSFWTESNLFEHLKKGTMIYAVGEPNVKAYSKDAGQLDVHFNLRVFSLKLLSSAKHSQ